MLLSGLGSGVVDVTSAVLDIIPEADAATVPLIKIVLVSPFNNVPILKLPGHGLKVTPPSTENSGPTISGGIASVKTTFWASAGPAFDTLIV